MHLAVINYSMNPENQVFAHQREIARSLSENFQSVTVFTADSNLGTAPEGLTIKSHRWEEGRKFTSSIRFLAQIIPFMFKNRHQAVLFSHMTHVHSFLIAPLCKLLGIRHYLWYAHTSKSPFLYLTYPLLDGLLTSTNGSCPIEGKRVSYMGQSIDISYHSVDRPPECKFPLSWYHIGRLDPSKNVEVCIEVLNEFRQLGIPFTLDIYGVASSSKYKNYESQLHSIFSDKPYESWVKFHGKVNNADVPLIALRHDGFIHAFQGSLDKAVLEAVASKRFVVSANLEFRREFGLTSILQSDIREVLKQQISNLLVSSLEQNLAEIEQRFRLLSQNHSRETWITKLKGLLLHEH